MPDSIGERAPPSSSLGAYLNDRRAKLDPAALGFPGGRRRTPGLRREEVAQRAGISPTWYTWLEQGRGGAPSAEVLDRIAAALLLTELEREHLYLLGLGRPPAVRFHKENAVTPRLQRVLDALHPSPALIRTAIWDVLAWNRAASSLFTDYAALPPDRRNILRFIFLEPHVRAAQTDWESVARFVVASFRADAVRGGADVEPLVGELCRESAEFRRIWADHDVARHSEAVKQIRHPVSGVLELEHSVFGVDGRSDLSMVVYNPATAEDAARIAFLIESRGPTDHSL